MRTGFVAQSYLFDHGVVFVRDLFNDLSRGRFHKASLSALSSQSNSPRQRNFLSKLWRVAQRLEERYRVGGALRDRATVGLSPAVIRTYLVAATTSRIEVTTSSGSRSWMWCPLFRATINFPLVDIEASVS